MKNDKQEFFTTSEMEVHKGKNLSKYSSPNAIGSTHWFRTLVGNAKRIGEFIEKNPNSSNNSEYGRQLQYIMKDLLEWQENNKNLI